MTQTTESGWVMVSKNSERILRFTFSELRRDAIYAGHSTLGPRRSRNWFLRRYKPVKATLTIRVEE